MCTSRIPCPARAGLHIQVATRRKEHPPGQPIASCFRPHQTPIPGWLLHPSPASPTPMMPSSGSLELMVSWPLATCRYDALVESCSCTLFRGSTGCLKPRKVMVGAHRMSLSCSWCPSGCLCAAMLRSSPQLGRDILRAVAQPQAFLSSPSGIRRGRGVEISTPAL